MRIAIFLFLVLINCSTLFAYEVEVTKLTDENFDPLPKEINVYNMGLMKPGEDQMYKVKQIATITLRIKLDEIGEDYDAARTQVKKEAAKLGGNLVYYVSGTIDQNIENICTLTFRGMRNEDVFWFLIDSDKRPQQYTENKFEVQKDGKVIYDKATGLMWQQSGSEKDMTYDETRNYIRQLNLEDFANYSDWRLPTLKEAITLLKPEKSNNGCFIDSVFDDKQSWIWTSTISGASRAWVVNFYYGNCFNLEFFYNYVRAVR